MASPLDGPLDGGVMTGTHEGQAGTDAVGRRAGDNVQLRVVLS